MFSPVINTSTEVGMQIEKNVPLPDDNPRNKKYPWGDMEVGDSVYLDSSHEPAHVRSAVSHYGKRTGKSFVTRKEGSGIRVWRER